MAREDLHFRLRIPEELKQKVQKAAEENRRSMTAEIVARLEESFERSPSDFNALQIVLDTNGLPIDWDQISEHLRAINRAGKFSFHTQHVHVITPELLSRMGREEEAERLARAYRQADKAAKRRARSPKPSDSEG